MQNRVRVNSDITVKEVRLINEKGEQLGIKAIGDALAYAKRVGLDLVELHLRQIHPFVR